MRNLINLMEGKESSEDIDGDFIPDNVNEEINGFLREHFSEDGNKTDEEIGIVSVNLYNHLEEMDLLSDMDFEDVYSISDSWVKDNTRRDRIHESDHADPIDHWLTNVDDMPSDDDGERFADELEPDHVGIGGDDWGDIPTDDYTDDDERFWNEFEMDKI